MNWDVVIGIEIHAQLRTGRKLFCADRAVFGDEPNVHVCPVCLGLPGALPTTDPDAVALAIRTAAALDCTIHEESVWARKNYFYPDLPKGYQITQFDRPIATDGHLVFDGESGEMSVRIRRIHMEEDAGKSIHDRVPGATAVDLNRAGTPLVEIVTEPDLRSPADVRSFLAALKQVLEYAEVSDCNMEEGSLRADANVSLRRPGETELGTKTEIKNVNSFSGIERALHLEIERQAGVLESGGTIVQQSLLWDDHRGEVRPMRSKEESHDYRYFPDPDLPPLRLSAEMISGARAAVPELPRPRRARFEADFGLSTYDADVLTRSPALANYFERVASGCGASKSAANWVMGPVQALLNETGTSPEAAPIAPERIAELIELVRDGVVSDSAARKALPGLLEWEGSAHDFVEAEGLIQVRDEGQLAEWVDGVIAANPDESDRFAQGEDRIAGFLVGQVMRQSHGKADPKRVRELLGERLR